MRHLTILRGWGMHALQLAVLLTPVLAVAHTAETASRLSELKAQTYHSSPHLKAPEKYSLQLGPRPSYLIDDMDASPLKERLQSCNTGRKLKRTMFSIGHRGAPLQFPEHTKESYEAAAIMGAGIMECDVTFTKDKELVCRHSQCDLHTTTNILAIPELAAKCSQPFTPADHIAGTPASARCCTSDITLEEFKMLEGKMDAYNPQATTVAEYMQGTPSWRTDLYATKGTLMTHAESISLFKQLGVKFTPELKSAEVPMPFEGTYSQADYAQQLINEYRNAGVKPKDVWPQSFDIADIRYWIANEPAYGRQAVYLDDADNPSELPSAQELQGYAAEGFNIVAPPMWALLELDANNNIVPSAYARNAKSAGLDIIAWSFERSGPLKNGGGWYYQTVNPVINNDGDMMEVLHVMAQDVGVIGVFSDWPASVSYYANCMGLP
ncbi:glycerophosphoryl diester phosphodiesterase [Rheinheimera pacifica]|uniref:glycerophosphodiester phosphodiesterase family protein n=1 Tax=Rheinheimera pacifica TaxID=173990 RepID=UPI002859FF1B|nr:glycerophosphodiester phosphodiesterase family protein [Rheinheimera pacifica]MDR6982042.1 glycerophosphoryl diester phosphodiesterase [Rheinheimera pacifica]